MKIAISNLAWNLSEDERVSKILQKLKISNLEIAPTKIWKNLEKVTSQDAKRYKSSWISKNITISALQSIFFGREDLKPLNSLNFLSGVFKLSQNLGSNIIVFGSPKLRQMAIQKNFFIKVADLAKQFDQFFCIEPNPPEYGSHFLTNTQETVDFLKKINHPNLRLHLDTGIMTINKENYRKSLQIAKPFLKHLHLSSPFLKSIAGLPHQQIAKALKEISYDGLVSVEMLPGQDIDRSLQIAKQFYA